MEKRKIDLTELAHLKDGTEIDMTAVTDIEDPAYALVKDEIESFVQRPRERKKPAKNTFYSNAPSTALKEMIDSVMKTRNVQENRVKRHMQFEFDRKMQRINRIKSRTFRRMQRREKLRKEEALGLAEESSQGSVSEEESSAQNPILELEGPKEEEPTVTAEPTKQQELVRNAFAASFPDEAAEFADEKSAIAEAEAPKIIETVLPGWGDWAGEGLEIKKTRSNTFVEAKAGVKIFERKDFKKGNVIINESTAVPEKYKSSLPYGYNVREYEEKMRTPISAEANSLKVFKRYVKMSAKEETVPGKIIKPAEFEPEY